MLATGAQQLLKLYLENWLEQVYKPYVKPNSYKQYKYIVNKYLIPSLGQVTIQKLTAAKVQAFYSQKLEEGLSPRSVILIHAVLHRALENAVKWGLVPRNVTKLVSLPHVERYDAQILTTDQAVKLLEVARGSRIEAMILIALTTGMRRGELLALHWDDVDFEKGMVYVRRTTSWITGYGYKESEPKTKAGRRKIVLAKVALEALKEHRVHQSEARSKASDKWCENGIIFCSVYGGFFNPAKVLEIFKQLLKDAGLPHMRFHDLRHSAATILLVAGVHPKVVQERLGHSTIAMTMDVYSHVLPSMQQEAAEKIDDMFQEL
jgi:integrase